jgi:hypothetical protein
MSTHTTKTRVLNSLSTNGKIGMALKLFTIWFDGDVPKAKLNLWNPLSYVFIVLAVSIVSLWRILEAVKETYVLTKEAYFGLGEYRARFGEPTWFKDLPE